MNQSNGGVGKTRTSSFVAVRLQFRSGMSKTIEELERELRETQKQLERARLRAVISETLTSALIDHYPDVALIMERDGTVVSTNDTTAASLRTTKEQLIGSVAFANMDAEAAERRRGFLAEIIDTQRPVHYEDTHRGRVFDSVAFPLRNPETGDSLVAVMSRDVTDARRAEEILRQHEARHWHSEKMEALGILASGIAHDFNNALTPILVNSKLAEHPGISEARRGELLQEIQHAGEHAAGLIRQILEYGRTSAVDVSLIDLAATVHEVEVFMRATIPADISIVVDLPDDLTALRADPTQLRQALINLCINAGQAMANDGGMLTISARAEHVDGDGPEELDDGDYVVVSVRDTGGGISPAVVARIFDPFFSTKSVDEGSGLGLYVVSGVALAHGGTVTVDSTLGKGTTLSIWLRQVDRAATQPPAEPQPASKPCSLHVMLVDDEPAVLRAASGILELDGHSVSKYTGRTDALRAFEESPSAFDLAILDQQLGDGSGIEIAEFMLERRPELAILLCSGNVTPQHRARCKVLGIRILTKPYTVDQLYASIASAVPTSGAGAR